MRNSKLDGSCACSSRSDMASFTGFSTPWADWRRFADKYLEKIDEEEGLWARLIEVERELRDVKAELEVLKERFAELCTLGHRRVGEHEKDACATAVAVNEVKKVADNAARGMMMANDNTSVAREEVKRIVEELDVSDFIVADGAQPELGEEAKGVAAAIEDVGGAARHSKCVD